MTDDVDDVLVVREDLANAPWLRGRVHLESSMLDQAPPAWRAQLDDVLDQDVEPCPFCGEPPIMESWHGGPPTKTSICCINDLCPAGPSVVADTMLETFAGWNRRAA